MCAQDCFKLTQGVENDDRNLHTNNSFFAVGAFFHLYKHTYLCCFPSHRTYRPCQLNNQSSTHQVWTDQTWPPPHCQDNKCAHHGNNIGCMTTTSCCNGKGSALTDTLDKSQFLYPNWATAPTGAPHVWQQYANYGAQLFCF